MSDQHTSPRLDAQKDLQIYKELIEQELKKDDSEIDTDAIDRWVEEALQLQGVEFHRGEQTSKAEIQQILARFASSEQKKVPKKPRRRIKKTVLGVLAAAILLAALSLTAYGFWGPSETFMKNIQKILRLERGEKLTISGVDYYADNQVKAYNTLEECMQAENISLLAPKNIPLAKGQLVTHSFDSSVNGIVVTCVYANEVSVSIYLENAPYPKDVMETQEDIERIQINNRTFYMISNPQTNMLVLFDTEYVYAFSSKSKEKLLETVSRLE